MYELQTKAIEAARKVLIENLGYQTVAPEDMFIVWFCKTLQNWKAIVSGRTIEEFIEVTHNGDRNETYVDVYCKTKNVCIKDESELKKLILEVIKNETNFIYNLLHANCILFYYSFLICTCNCTLVSWHLRRKCMGSS